MSFLMLESTHCPEFRIFPKSDPTVANARLAITHAEIARRAFHPSVARQFASPGPSSSLHWMMPEAGQFLQFRLLLRVGFA